MRTRSYPPNELGTDWNLSDCPAANVRATVTRAASVQRNVRNVCTGFTVTLCGADATDPAVTTVTVALIDGASGGTSYLWGPVTLAVPAAAGFVNGLVVSGLFEYSQPNGALTLEFSVAGGLHTKQSITMQGTTT